MTIKSNVVLGSNFGGASGQKPTAEQESRFARLTGGPVDTRGKDFTASWGTRKPANIPGA